MVTTPIHDYGAGAGCSDPMEEDFFLLSLGAGFKWRVTASCDACHVAAHMAEIMQLPVVHEGDVSHIHFTRCDPGCAVCARQVAGMEDDHAAPDFWRFLDLPYLRMWTRTHSAGVLCQCLHWDNVISHTARVKAVLNPVYSQVISQGGFPIHGGLVQLNGKGIILAAHGEVGKTTACARLPQPFQARCDDETVIVNDGGMYVAHPMPTWSGYDKGRPLRSTPLHPWIPVVAVCFLRQSQEERLEPMGQGEAAVRMHQSAWETLATYTFFSLEANRKPAHCRVFKNACRAATHIPCYTLHLSLTGEFWTLLHTLMPSEDKRGV